MTISYSTRFATVIVAIPGVIDREHVQEHERLIKRRNLAEAKFIASRAKSHVDEYQVLCGKKVIVRVRGVENDSTMIDVWEDMYAADGWQRVLREDYARPYTPDMPTDLSG